MDNKNNSIKDKNNSIKDNKNNSIKEVYCLLPRLLEMINYG